MSKEYTQALDDLFGLAAFQKSLTKEQFERAQKYFDIIEEALQRLEVIDNADSSEALEKLDNMYFLCTPQHYYDKLDNYYNSIKNYILKTQEALKNEKEN